MSRMQRDAKGFTMHPIGLFTRKVVKRLFKLSDSVVNFGRIEANELFDVAILLPSLKGKFVSLYEF